MWKGSSVQPCNSMQHITSEDFDDEIEKSINLGISLESTITQLERLFHRKLGKYDLYCVEDKYVELQINNYLLEKVPDKITKSINVNTLLEFINKLNTLEDLDKCCDFVSEFLNESENKQLKALKQLCATSNKVKLHEKQYIKEFRRKCYITVNLKADYVSGEIDFNKCLTELLKSTKNPAELCKSLGLLPEVVKDFENDSCFQEFLRKLSDNCIINNKYVYKLQNCAKLIINQDNFLLNKDIKITIESYLKKPTLKEVNADGRFILEISGKHIVISNVLQEIEKKLENSHHIEEVRFVNAGVIHIDINLSASTWQGKNLVVYTETAIVSDDKKVTWDVSGKDAESTDWADAGTGDNGIGLSGTDGQPGESGGNVLFIVGELKNAQNLKIRSNGGNGGKGQDGGIGIDGKDGVFLEENTFKDIFPPVAKFLDSKKSKHLELTKDALSMMFESVQHFFYGQSFMAGTISKMEFEKYLSDCISGMLNIYCELKTNKGCKITFSFYCGDIKTGCQALLLHEGSLGEEGKPGGSGGQGGKGGSAGEIIIQVDDSAHPNVSLARLLGNKGNPGKTGLHGNPGKKGVDRGYIDYSRDIFRDWPKYSIPGLNDNIALHIKYFTESNSERVFCAHNDLFAEIVKKPIGLTRQRRYNVNTNELTSNHEGHTQRKKAIIEDSIRKQYEEKLCNTDLFKLNSILEKVKDSMLELFMETSLQTEQITTELKVVRQISYSNQNPHISIHQNDLNSSRVEKEEQHDNITNVSATELVKLITDDPGNFCIWKQLSQTRLNIIQLQELWNIIDKISLEEDLYKHINIVFCNKYQLATLECLAQNLTNSCSVSDLRPYEYMLKYFDELLTITEEQDSIGIEEYLVRDSTEKREETFDLFNDKLDSVTTNRKVINNTLLVFLNEFSCNPVVKKTLEEVQEFEKNKEQKLAVKLIALKSALTRSKTKNIYNAFIESIVKQTNQEKIMFENEIQKDKFFYSIYESYVKSTKHTFNWETLLNSDNHEFVQLLLNTVMQSGPFCAFYREFLAYHFETNIMVYTRNEKNETMLAHNHNPTASTTVHVLLKEEEFIKLRVDNELVEMVCSQKTQGALINNILIHLDSCSDKNQLDELISKQPIWVLSGSYNGFEKSDRIRVRIAHIIMEENNIRGVLNAYNLDKDKELIKCKLEKLKFQYTGCESILYYMALHFNCEGAHISAEELCLLINFILKCALKMPHTIPLLSWIVAAYPQEQWLVEVILLKFDLNFSSLILNPIKSKWRQYLLEQTDRQMLMLMLEKITDKNTPASVEKIEETLYLLSRIPPCHDAGLKKLDFDDWTYYLKDKFWFYQLKLIADWSNDQLATASYYMVVLENTVGTSLCENLINVLKSHKLDLASESTRLLVTNYLRIFTNHEVCLNDDLLDHLKDIKLSDWKGKIEKTFLSSSEDRTLAEILEILKNTSSASTNVSNKLNVITQAIEHADKIKIMLEKMEYSKFKEWISKVFLGSGDKTKSVLEQIKEYVKLPITDETFITLAKNIFMCIFSKSTISEVDTLLKSDEGFMEPSLVQEKSLSVVFAAVVAAVEREHFKIRATQKLAIMTLLKSSGNVLSQISTGEGKSIIIVIVAIINALNGQKVDIVTSSHVLAERDAVKYKNVFNLFGVNVDHNYSENIETRKKVYSNNNVVYGELANFQRDFLLHEIYNKNVLGDRKLSSQIIIVDEVDSMLLDRGNNTLYLSHEIPGLDKLEEVFIYIWVSLNTLSGQPNIKSSVLQLKENILNEIFGLVTIDDLKSLDTDLDINQVNQIFNLLVKNGIISSNGKLLVKDCLLGSIPETCLKKDHIWYLLKKIFERKKRITIPNYLNQFVETHLEEWIKSGIRAMSMEPSVDYVVDVDRSETSGDTSPNITIIDRDTGTDLINSQWEDGLHQFLQLKHGCRLSIISLKAVFISNVSYLKKYKTLFGLTGTIGSTREQHLLKEIYDIDFIMIPTAKTKSFTEEESVLCTSTDEWTTTIWENASKKIKQNRSVLIICETVRDVYIIKQKFDQVYSFQHVISPSKIFIYKRDYETLTIADNLKPCHVIISTNLAGRGTDIKLSEELINVGGLHVCLSFLPSNSRVEEQAFGRAARNGQPGSAQIIFKNSAHKITSNTTVIGLKKQRDADEVSRIADIKHYNKNHVQPEERCFKEFHILYEQIDSLEHEENIKKILLQVSLDKWAFWLEKNKGSRDLKSSNSFKEEINSLCSKDYATYIEDPSQLSKLGLLLIDSNKYDQAIMLFDRVIKDEPSYSENARYYRMCAKMVKKDLTSEEIITEANLVVKLLKERIQSLLLSANIIDQFKKRDLMNILQVESFKEQHINICKMYEIFLENIYSIIGYGFYAHSLALPPLIDDECASRIYNDLMRKQIISGPRMKKNISGADLGFVALYGLIPTDILCDLNLYSTRNLVLDEGKLLKMLKQNCSVPSRELFWKQLLSKKILINEEKYSIVDVQKLKLVDPSLNLVIDSLKITNKLEDDNQIWLYQLQDIDCFDEKEFVLTKKANLKKEIGEYKYKLLKHKYVVHPNKQATLLKLHNNIQFDYFDCLIIEDFCRVNISSEIALDIIHELEEKHVILKIDENRYCLSVQPRDIGSVKLSRFKAYSDEIVNLLTICFAFRLALHKTWDSMHNQTINDDSICLPLQIRLEKRILEDLYDHEIIKKSAINPNQEKQIANTLKSLYPNKWTKEELDLIFSDLFELSSTRMNIIECLIENNWLSEVKQYNILTSKKYSFQQENLKELPSAVVKYTETIKLVLKRNLSLSYSYHQLHIQKFVYQHASSVFGIETPSLSLVHLSDIINERKMPLRECTIFSLNGFDKLIILEELKYSCKMIISTFVVALLGVFEITVGAVYGLPKFVEEGVGDLEYVISCILSGHFSWNDYSSQKISNVIQSVSRFILSGKFSSSFGQKLSLSSMWNVAQRKSVKSVAIEIVRHSVTTCAVVASHAAIDNVIEPKLAELGKILVSKSTSNIDSIVDEHPVVETIQTLHLQLGKEKTTTLIKLYSCKVMEEYKSQDDKDLLLLFGKLYVKITSSINIMKNISCTNLLSFLSCVENIIECLSELITHSGFLKEIQLLTIANEMTDSLQDLLGKHVNDVRTGSQLERPENCDAEIFLNEILISWKQGIQNVYIYNINKRIIHPLIIHLKNMFIASLSRASKKRFVSYSKDEGLSELKLGEQLKISEEFNNSGNFKDYKAFLCMEYDDCLTYLLVKTQNASIFLEILRKSYTADISFIKQCCSVIPAALKTQGLNLPMLQIVIESDSVQPISGGVVTPESDVLTLNIVPNENFLENLKRNKIIIKTIFDALYKSILQLQPKFKNYNGRYIRNLVAKAIEEDNSILQHICRDCSIEPLIDVCNTSFEEQNSLGRRVSLQYSDRKEGVCSFIDQFQQSDKIKKCVIEGFKTALEKINNHIHLNHPYLKHFKLTLEEFIEIQHEVIPSKQFSVCYFDYYATHYELVIPLEHHQVNSLVVDYKVTMSLISTTDRTKFHPPNSPHIEYKINPVDISSNAYLVKEGFEGFVMLNFEYEDTVYSVKDCHSAGELVLPILS